MKKDNQFRFLGVASIALAVGFSPSRLKARTSCGRFSTAAHRRFWMALSDEVEDVFEDTSTNQALSSLLNELGDDVPLPPLQGLATDSADSEASLASEELAIEEAVEDDIGWTPSVNEAGEAVEETNSGVDIQVIKRNKQLRVKQAELMKDIASAIHRKDAWAVKKADEMIEEMYRIYDNNRQDRAFKPPTRAYNLLIQALAQQPNNGKTAERVMGEMFDNGIRPDLVTYTAVVGAYANSDNGASQAERILFQALENEDYLDLGGGTWIVLIDSVLNAWAQQGTVFAAERAAGMLERMAVMNQNNLKPGLISYSTVMKAFSRCGDVDRVMAILNGIVEGKGKNKVNLKPDLIMFNIALGAWANSRSPKSGQEAMKLLKMMDTLHDEKGYDTKPDVASFNIVITAISRSGRDDAPMQAERVVQMMQERENTKPDTITFNAVLNAWSQSSKKSAPARAQHILEFLIKHPKLEPDIVTFSTTMNAWARSKDAEKVQKTKELLDRLLTMYEEGDRPKSLKPTSVPFNTLINACGFPNPNATEEERKHFLQIAASTYGRLRNYKGARPDTVTYGNMLKCIGKLLPMGDTRIKLARQIFDQCVSDGLVGYLVWDEMTQTVPFDALEPILPVPLLEGLEVGEDIDHSRLPRRWRNNVPLKQDRIKKEQKMLVLKKELGAKEKPRGMRKGRIKRIGLQYTAHGENSWGAGGGGSGIP